MIEYHNIAVFCEITEGKLTDISTELLACGRKLANSLNETVNAVLIGKNAHEAAQLAISYGADIVFVVEASQFELYQTETYLAAFEKLVKEIKPQAIIMGQTTIGRDLAPALAFKLHTAATLDCVDLSIDPNTKRLLQTKPVYGGNVLAVYATDCNPQIATIRAKTVSPLEADEGRTGEIVNFEVEIDIERIKSTLIEKVPEQVDGMRLEDARVVVSGGRGIGSTEGFQRLEELATLLNGTVGATRPVCDNGWQPTTKQVGLTGKMVTPEIYFAIGISGASQHMAGCYAASNIVAINDDDGANIFREAHYGVLGDWELVLEGFFTKLKELGVG